MDELKKQLKKIQAEVDRIATEAGKAEEQVLEARVKGVSGQIEYALESDSTVPAEEPEEEPVPIPEPPALEDQPVPGPGLDGSEG